MKLKALLLACAVAGAGASFALADDGHGKHHEHGATTTGTTATGTTATTTTGMTTTSAPANCARVELAGTLASVSAKSFTLTVKKAEDDNDDDTAATSSLVGQTVTIAVDASTRVQWQGTGTLTGPNVGDRARVNAFSCGTPATLTARRVKADGPRAASGEVHVNGKSHK
jgi:hypothetical protein